MKKKLLAILATGAALSMGAAVAFIAGPAMGTTADAEENSAVNKPAACAFVDEDGDGVCDNKGNGQGLGNCGKNFVDEDGDGVCDNKGNGQGRGNCGGAKDGSGKGNGQGRGNCGGSKGGNGKGSCGGRC